MTIKDKVVADLKTAMLARDEERTGALRLIKAEILKAEKEKGQAVSEEREMALLQSMIKQRQDSIEQFEAAGRQAMADKEKSEMAIIKAYLPESLSEDELTAAIDGVLATIENPDPKQLGKIIGQVMAKLKASGRPFDAKMANERIKTRLGQS